MAEYIERERFQKSIMRNFCNFKDTRDAEYACLTAQIEPAADVVEVKHGEWIYHHNGTAPTESTQECSRCHEQEYITLHNENYCPNCGAKMSK